MLNPDFRDMLSALCVHKVEFLLVGAYAMAAHGLPRATGDIDIWVNPTPENATRVMRALIDFGAPIGDLTLKDLSTPGIVFQMGLPPNRIDILTKIDAVDFDKAYHNCILVELDGLNISVIGRQDLLTNKRATARPKDRIDADWLAKQQ
jgi:hypothetical protein